VDVGFLPAPVDLATVVRLRLSELTLHSWDVRVTFDDAAVLPSDAASELVEGTLPLAWIGKAGALDGRTAAVAVTTTEPQSQFTLRLQDPVSVDTEDSSDPDGTLTLPAEAWLRLVAGRLPAPRTPAEVKLTGSVDLDLLRAVFPGY
jgi:hypothetical protein